MKNEPPPNAEYFLDLIQKNKRGKFKIYIGMSAGVGKTYRMLQEAHALLRNHIDVKIGFIETHFRPETHQLLEGLPTIPRRKLFYKGKELEEMDLQGIINARPTIVIIDELAHSNIEGSKNQKRWQDVIEILEAGINVISAVNIQHIESLNEEIKAITQIEVQERVPDSILKMADEVVNIDLTADELITRLKEGKIYQAEKIPTALNNFFTNHNILQLRELALKEVASQVERKVETEVTKNNTFRHEKFLACISSNERQAKNVIRKTARLANYYNSQWFVLYVQTKKENSQNIALDKQRHLINNFKLATELGAEIIRVESNEIAKVIVEVAQKKQISNICMGKPKFYFLPSFFSFHIINRVLRKINAIDIDLIILS